MDDHKKIVKLLQDFIGEYDIYLLDCSVYCKEPMSIEDFYYKEYLKESIIDGVV